MTGEARQKTGRRLPPIPNSQFGSLFCPCYENTTYTANLLGQEKFSLSRYIEMYMSIMI
jgi:hypothetical protein